MKIRSIVLAAILAGGSLMVGAAETAANKNMGEVKVPAAKTLDELLQMVKQNKIRQTKENKDREAEFLRDRNKQRDLLNAAMAEKKAEEDRTERLKAQMDANEKKLAAMEETLFLKAGSLGEMVGVVKQVAGDTAARFKRSIISAQYPSRHAVLDTLSQAKEMPELPAIRGLWEDMQMELTEQAKVVRFNREITNLEGRPEPRDITRIGVFNMVSDGEYLVYDFESQDVKQLSRQPRELGLVSGYLSSTQGSAPLALDPSRGTILSLEVKRESWKERVENHAGIVGWATVGVLILGLLIVAERFMTLIVLKGKMAAQANSSTPGNNPLGRIMAVYLANKDDDVENLELKLDEAILKETPRIEKRITIIKVFAAVAPLMGLLGTVTGMIETFQSITLYGTGDPKIMAGGISSALMTTVIGIVAALPLILLHSVVSGMSKGLIHMLEEQSTGLIAQHEEEAGA